MTGLIFILIMTAIIGGSIWWMQWYKRQPPKDYEDLINRIYWIYHESLRLNVDRKNTEREIGEGARKLKGVFYSIRHRLTDFHLRKSMKYFDSDLKEYYGYWDRFYKAREELRALEGEEKVAKKTNKAILRNTPRLLRNLWDLKKRLRPNDEKNMMQEYRDIETFRTEVEKDIYNVNKYEDNAKRFEDYKGLLNTYRERVYC